MIMQFPLRMCAPSIICLILAVNSGCGVVRDFAVNQGKRLIEGQLGKIDKKLMVKYGIDLKEDSFSGAVKKMIEVEGIDNPSLVKRLLVNPPESWGDMVAVATEAATIIADKEKRNAEITGTKNLAQGAGGSILLLLLGFAHQWWKRRKMSRHLQDGIEKHGTPELKKALSKGEAGVTADLAREVNKRFNGKEKAA